MDMLILGNSDTRGEFSPGTTWPGIAGKHVTAATGQQVVVTERTFSATRPDAPSFAENVTRELSPDLVILPLGTFAFTVGFTWVRVQSLFGRRVANWYRRGERAVDQRSRGPGRLPNRMGRTARAVVRRLVGTQPMTTWPELARCYGDVLQSLARIEHVDVLLVAYPSSGRGPAMTMKNQEELCTRFLQEMCRQAAVHHYHVVDSEAAYRDAPNPEELVTPDGFHNTLAGHEVLGETVAGGILALLREPVGAQPPAVAATRG